MGLGSTLAGLFGTALLLVAALAAVFGVVNVVTSLLWGVTGARILAIWVAAGVTLTFGFFGYFTRKVVAGQVLPVDYDVSVAFRGGQGGL